MSYPGAYADWQVCLDLFIPLDTVIPEQWSAADIVSEALPALSFLTYIRYDRSLNSILDDEDLSKVIKGIRGPFRGPGLRRKKTKKIAYKFRRIYNLRKIK
jgi:hypothetical protein